MKRTTKPAKYDAILAADIHISKETPIARIDDYWLALQRKLLFIKQLQEKHSGIPVVIAGDLFNNWNAGPEIERWCIQNLFRFVAVPGQHDLPYHNLELFHQCSLAVLNAADPHRFTVIWNEPYHITGITFYPFPWKVPPSKDKYDRSISAIEVAICHYLIEADWPGAEHERSHAFLKRMDYDLVLTGDNHKTFIDEYNGRRLINPGSLMRRNADQIDHKPVVYLWNTKNEIEPVYLPIEPDVVTREHIAKEEEREDRIDAYVVRLEDDYEVGLSFEKNLEAHFVKNKTHNRIQEMAWEDVAE